MDNLRRPARDTYDAIVDLVPAHGISDEVYALVKLAYRFDEGGVYPDAAEALQGDIRDPDARPRVPRGTDFWMDKPATDVVVIGSAHAPEHRPVPWLTARVWFGGIDKRVAVFGDRSITWRSDGTAHIGEPEPFTEMPLSFDRAYGGVDPRITPTLPQDSETLLRLEADDPGMYPRNPFGRGYLIHPTPIPGAVMPNLEDPDDLLTVERLFVHDPQDWYLQPHPWALDWVHPMMFPRMVYSSLGLDAWFPAPEDERLPEVRRAWLPPLYRSALPAPQPGGPHPLFYQEASHGLALSDVRGTEQVVLDSMHPERPRLSFKLPGEDACGLKFFLEGSWVPAAARLHSVTIRPSERRFFLVYGARTALHRGFLPGIHKHIPIGVSVNGDAPVMFDTPPTLRDRLREAQASRATQR